MRDYFKERTKFHFSIIISVEFFLFFLAISSFALDKDISSSTSKENRMNYAERAEQPVENEIYIGKVLQYFPETGNAVVYISSAQLQRGDRIHFKGNVTDFILEISNMSIGGREIKRAKKGQTVFIFVHQPVEIGDSVFLGVRAHRQRGITKFLYPLVAILGGASSGLVLSANDNGNGPGPPPPPEPPVGDYKFEPKELFKLAIDPRALGLGDAVVSIADDSNAVFYNPAGLGQIEEISSAVSFFRPFSKINNIFYLSCSHALPTKSGSFGLGLIFLSHRDIIAFIPENSKNSLEVKNFSDTETVFLLSYAPNISNKIRIGTSLKLVYQKISRFSDSYVDCDLGFIFNPLKSLNVGISFQNFIRFFSSDQKYSFYYPMVSALKVGVGYKFLDNWMISLENDYYKDEKFIARLGLEYDTDNFQFRLGGNSYNGGILAISGGIKIRIIKLTYSFAWNNKFGNSHGISLNLNY